MSIELYNRHGKRVSRARGLAALESITRCFPPGFVAMANGSAAMTGCISSTWCMPRPTGWMPWA